VTRRTRSSDAAIAATISRVRSSLPSSATTISHDVTREGSASRSRVRQDSMRVASLNVGTTTDRAGAFQRHRSIPGDMTVDRSREIIETFDVQFVNKAFIP
jgi:hypothetical protein